MEINKPTLNTISKSPAKKFENSHKNTGCKYFGIPRHFREDFPPVLHPLVHVFISGSDSTGHPTMSSFGCTCSVASADITFHGGTAWIYNLFSDLVADKLKDMIGGGNGIVSYLFSILTKS